MAGVVEAVLNGCNFVSISADDSYLVIHAKKDLLYIFNCIEYSLAQAILFCLQPAKVTAHWHKGTTFMIKFDESVIVRDKMVEGR